MATFLSWEDTRRMIDRTIVSYEGRLVYIPNVDPGLWAQMIDAETGERFKVLADFDKIENPKHGRLGYVNIPGLDAPYVVRYSARAYKMGFCIENLIILREGAVLRRIENMRFGAMLEGIANAYSNNYPTFAEAYRMSKDLRKTVAYDRSFAITKTGRILYQSHVVGIANGDEEDAIVWTKKGLLASFVRERPKLNWR